MSRKKKEERKTQKGKFKNKLCFLAAAIAAGTITTEDKKLYGGNVCTVRVNGILTGNPTTLGSAPGTDAIACGNGAVANGTNSITTGTGAFTGYSGGIAIGENSSAVRESDIAIGTGAGLYNQGLNAKRLPNGNLNTSATRGYNVIIGANAMVGDDNNTSVHTSQGIAIGGSGTQRDTPTRKYGDSGGAWAKGDQSIAIGGDTIADGHSSIAIGGDDLRKAGDKTVTYTLASGTKTGSLRGALGDLAGVPAGDVQRYNATKSGAGAVALGVKSVSGDLSLSIGTMSTADKVNATAVGSAAVADLDNSVALGGGSTTANAAGTQVTSVTIDGVTYNNFSGGSGTKAGDVVSVGRSGTFNRQIKNVAAGNISATSTDAVNGSQLYSVAQTLQDRFKYVSINSTETGNADNKGALATNSIAIGPNASATVTSENAVVVGNGAKTTEQVMNPGAPTQWTKTGKNSVVIGNKASTNSEGSVAIGHEAKVDNTTNNSGSTIGRYKNDDNSTYMGTSLAQNNIYADPSYVGTQGIAIGANSYSDYQGMSMGVGARSKNLSLALGYFSNAEGTSSIATGVGAYAKGANSISSGRQSSTISTGSVALGVAARGGSTADGGLGGSIAVGAASDATHEQAIAIGGITNANTATLEQGRGDNTQATAARATAIGANAKAQAESSIAFGTKANVGSAGTNAVAIGKDSSATVANGVALGSESKATTAAGVTGFDMADGRSNVYSGLAGTAKTANMAAVSVGDGANKTRQITGVAAGKEDTDAVNVAQLKSTNLKIAGNTTSGGADVRLHDQTLTVKGDGTYLTSTAAGNTITMELKQDVKDKIDNAATKKLDNLDPAGVQKIKDTAAWNVVANAGTAEKVQGGDTVKFINGDNIEVTQAGKDFTFATKKDVTFDSVTINNGPKLSSTGIDAGNKKISNLADGTANNDAVNLGQLNNAINNATTTATSTEKVVASTAADNIATVAPSTGQNLGDKNATYEVSVSKTAVQNIAKDAAAWNVSTNGGTAEKVEGGDTVNFVNGDNIEVTNTGKDITIATKKDATFDSVTINNGPKLSSTGVDAGNKKITNVADGTVGAGSTDAVNGGQLHDVKTSVTNNTTALNDLKSNTIKLSGDSTSTTAERLDKNGGIEFGVKSGDTNYLTSTATGTDITLDLTSDTKAKIDKVTTLSNNTISLGGDTGTTNTQSLDKTGGIKFNVKGDGTYLTSNATNDDVTLDLTQTTKDKINNAATNKLDNLDPAGVQKIKDTAAWNVVANSGTAEKVQGGDTVKFIDGDNIEITQAGKDFTFATKKDVTFDSVTINNGPKLSSTGIDAGNKKISNLADGTANNDAVNLGQLNNAINNATTTATSTEKVVASTAADNIATVAPSTGQNLGDKNATYEVSVSKTAVQNIAKDAAAWNVSTNGGTAEKVEGGDTVNFVNGDNIEVTNTGKDITIATKKDATFDSVTINNGPKLSSTGVDAGNKKITNVADGTVGAGSKDAVNGGQLHDVKTSVTNNTTALNDLKSNTIKLSGDSTSTTAERLDKNGGIEFGVKSGDTNYLTSTATGTDITLDLTSDTKAKIDKVTTLSNNTISLGGDTGTTNTQSLDKTGGIKFNVKGDGTYLTSSATGDDVTLDLTQTTKDKINNAATNKLDNLDPAGVQKIKDTAAWNVVANAGTAEKVQGGDTVKFINGDNIEITQAGKDFTFATKKDVTFDSVTINNGPKLSSTGIDAGNKKISNLADGTANNDAVNLGQLNNAINNATTTATSTEKVVASTAADNIATVAPSTGQNLGDKNATYEVSVSKTAVQNIAKDAAAWNVSTNGGTAEKVEGGDTVNFVNGDNIEVTNTGKDITIATKKDATFDSVTINNGPKLSSTGVDAGNKKITNVADGTVGAGSKDAVNGGQLHDVKTSVTNNTTALNNLKNNTISLGGDTGTTNTQSLDKTGGIKFNVKGDGTYLTSNATNDDVTLDLTQTTKDKINNAATNKLDNLDPAGVQKIKDTAAWNVVANSGTAEKVQGGDTVKFINGDNIEITQAGKDFTFATKKDVTFDSVTINNGPKLSSTGIDAGNKKISNLADGTANNDAVNLGQLNTAINNATATATSTEKVVASTAADNIATVAPSTGQNLGDKNATYEVSVSKTAVQNIAKDAAAWNVSTNGGTAEKVEGGDTVNFVNGDNIEVTNTGKDITIATKKDATFDSVTINNGPKLSSTGVDAGNKKITNVADGTVGAGSKDAVNGGQLHDVKTSVTNNTTALNNLKNNTISLGGDTGTTNTQALDKTGGIKFNVKGDGTYLTSNATGDDVTLDLTQTTKDKINNAATNKLDNLDPAGVQKIKDTAAWNVSTNGGTAEKVEGGDTVNFVNGDNIEVTNTGKDITIATKKDATFDSVTINNGPKLSSTGVDAGNKKITNVADGTVGAGSKDAVNGGQLHDVKTSVTNNTTALNNLKNNTISLGGDTGTTNTQALDKTGGIKFNVKGDGTYLTSNATNDDVTLDLTQATKDKINNAATNKLDNLDPAGVQKIKDTAAWNVVANSGTAEKVQGGDTVKFINGDNIEITQAGKDFTFATKKDVTFDSVTINNGPKLSSTGIDAGNKKISNLADGTANNDAVNLGQLNTAINNATATATSTEKVVASTAADNIATVAPSTGQNLGDKNATYEVSVSKTAVQNIAKDAAAWNVSTNGGTAEKVEGGDTVNFVNGDNIEVTNTGKDITIATKRDVNFDSVTVPAGAGNVVINNSGINAGNNKITNVADGTVAAGSKDAVNGGQLHDVKTSVTNNTNALNDLKSNTIKLSGDSTSTTAERLDKNGGIEFGVKSGDTNYLTSTATGTDITLDLTSDTKAKIDKVTTLSNNTISLGGDTGTTNTQSLDKTGGIKFNVKGDGTYLTSNATNDDVTLDLTQTTKDKINNAATNKLDNLDPAGVQKIKDTAAWNVVANSGTAEKVQGGDTVKFINGDNIEITQAGKDFTFATKKDVTFDSVTINNGPKLSSTGIDAGNKKISNLADGTANNDAVNLGQLNTAINNATATATSTEKVVASTAADNIATVAPSTGQNLGDKNATYEVSVSKTAVQNIAKDAAAWNVSTNGGTAEKVEGGDTVNFVNGDNIEVTNTGKDITIATKRDVNFDSVTVPAGAGNVVINNSGINAGNNKITNVADGTVAAGSKDAINGGQLHDVKTSVTNNTTALNDLKSNTIKLSGDSTSTTAERLDKNGGIEFGVKSGDTNYLTSTATGTDITLDLTSDTKAKIDKVTTLSNNTISLGGDTGTTNTQSLDKTGGIKFNVKGDGTYLTSNATNDDVTLDLTQTTKDKINNAATNKLDNLDPAGVQKIKDTAAWNVVANSGTAEKVQGGDTVKFINGDNIEITQAGKDFTFATKKDVTFDSVTINNGPKLSSTGIDAGNKKISNLADGTANNDAVNLGQLNTAINNAGAAATIKYKANGGAPETVKLSDGLDFVNGSNTTATVGPNGVVKYDVNLGKLAVGADGKAGADGKTGADGTVGKDGIATTQDVAKAINSSAWKVTSTASTGTVNTPSVEDVKNGDTVKFDAGDNIEITQNGKDFTFATKKDVTFDSVTINNGGPKLSATGIDAANKKITNVANGDVTATSKDAVNGSQLYGLSKNTVTVSGDSTSTTPQTLDQTGGIKLGIKSGDTNFLTSTATGTDVTLDLTQATKDKINKVTTLSSNTISLGGDTGTTNTQSLDKTGGIKFNVKGDGTYLTSNATNDDVTLDLTQATKDKINNAATNKLDNLDPAGIQKIKDTAAWNVVANNGTAEKVEGGNTVKFIDGDNIAITQAGKDFTIATKRDVNFDSVTVPAGAGNVVINNSGINAGNNKITNVADGTIAPGSKDAVNGGQLHDVQNTINAGAFTVSANGGAKDRIAKDENIDFENADGNIAISYDATGNKFTYNLSPNLNLGPAGSLRIGDALLNNGGLTIVNGPSITSAGVDAGNKKITNVADGTIGAGSKDAINGGQLHDVQTNLQTSINNNAQNIANNTNAINNLNAAVNNPITFTGDSGNNIDRKLGETLNIKGGATGNLTSGNIGVEADSTTNTLNVKLAENIDLGTNGSVKMGDTKINDNGLTINGGPSVTKAGIDAGNKKVTNVANGDITATSKDAVNGSQLHGVADSIKNSIGGNTILNPDGTITTNNIGGTGHNNIHDAIASVNNAANQRTTVVAGDNIDVTVSTNATGGNEYTVATKRDIVVDSVSVANNGPSMNSNGINAGGKTISNLGAGVNPNDAVNVAQLDAVKNSPITFGADTGTDHAATLGSRVSITGDNKNITTSISGNNIQVAMSETPSFGTVNVNDANTGTITGASNVTLDNLDEDGTVGRVATEAQLAAVRNEVAGTKDIDNKLRGFKRGADAGTASAMAMAGIPQVINPGENAIGASISAYKQQTAVAVGYTRASKNGRAVLKISGSVNSNSELGFSLGFMKGWD